jgi:hypothetical protein
MSFIEFLQGIGDRLGILETISASNCSDAVRIQTRIVTLQELACEIRSEEVCTLADAPAEPAIPFDQIFETAGISSHPEIWTIDRLKDLISSEPFKNLPREEVQTKVLEMLRSEGVSAETIVKDAMARDQALDAYEARMSEKMRDRRDVTGERCREIELQIKSLQSELAGLQTQLAKDEEKWLEWRRRKRAHERELASATSYIVDHPVITTDDEVS